MVRLKDIAEESGYSVATVQQVLTTRADRFSQKTQTTIRRVAASLGYQPNLNARALQAGRSMLVGVLYSAVNHAGALSFFGGVQDALAEKSFSPISLTHSSIAHQLKCLDQCRQRKIDGLIINAAVELDAPDYVGTIASELPGDIPVVEVLGGFLPNTATVRFDFFDAGRRSTESLIKSGLRRVYLLTHDQHDAYRDPKAPYHSDWRFSEGYRKAAEQAKVPVEVIRYELPRDLTLPGAETAMAYSRFSEWLRSQPTDDPVGICCATNAQGLAVVQALREKLGPKQSQVKLAYSGDPNQIIDCPAWCKIFPVRYDALGSAAANGIFSLLSGNTFTGADVKTDLPVGG